MSPLPKPLTIRAAELRDLCADSVELAALRQKVEEEAAYHKAVAASETAHAAHNNKLERAIACARDELRNARTDIVELKNLVVEANLAPKHVRVLKKRIARDLAIIIGKLDTAGMILQDADVPF